MTAFYYTLIPVLAVLLGAIATAIRRPGPAMTSAIQHLAAGVVFAAAATEILPDVMHSGSAIATLVGGALGMLVMLGLKSAEERFHGPLAMIGAMGTDLLIDGLVLGLAFAAGARAGLLLTIALTLEVLFLGVTVSEELGQTIRSKVRVVVMTVALALLMPLGTLIALPVAALPAVWVTGFLSFGLIALLYLVIEELLVEAHTKPDSPLISAMFFVGFLALLTLEEVTA
ncbi:transporter [Sphingomonas koreensis]|nr:transporter [Sphingomonas koreensis]